MVAVCRNTIQEPCGIGFSELKDMADDVLMAHLSSGHDDALAVLFQRYHRLVLSVALKIVRDAGEAEDVMQGVFLEIYRASGQFDPAKGTLNIWILQYAYHRSMNRRQLLRARHFYSGHEDITEHQDSLCQPTHGPMASQEVQRLVRQSLETLNPMQRKILQLAYFEGLTLKEIAEETGESFGNVRHHYYRGLAKLRAFITTPGREPATYRAKEIADANA
jgi:RNA polymerase sigma-70 factor (ECF subfamily)